MGIKTIMIRAHVFIRHCKSNHKVTNSQEKSQLFSRKKKNSHFIAVFRTKKPRLSGVPSVFPLCHSQASHNQAPVIFNPQLSSPSKRGPSGEIKYGYPRKAREYGEAGRVYENPKLFNFTSWSVRDRTAQNAFVTSCYSCKMSRGWYRTNYRISIRSYSWSHSAYLCLFR